MLQAQGLQQIVNDHPVQFVDLDFFDAENALGHWIAPIVACCAMGSFDALAHKRQAHGIFR
jgi:hypothetical protein